MSVLAFLATYLIHSTLLLGAAWLLARHAVRSEAWRETLWKAALVGAVVTALIAQRSPLGPLRVMLPAPAPAGFAGGPEATGSVGGESGASRASVSASVPASPSSSLAAGRVAGEAVEGHRTEQTEERAAPSPAVGGAGSAPWLALVLAGWAGIALLLTGRLAWRRVQLARVLRGRRAVTEPAPLSMLAELRRLAGIWVPVGLTSTPALASPLVPGGREICVPERFLTDLGPAEQRAALAHELAHLARRDPAWILFAMLLECVFFFQPLQWIARRRLRETIEYRADGWAVRLAGVRLSLAKCLAEVASWVSPSPHPALAERVAMAEGGSPLLSRVRRLLELPVEPEPRAGLRLTVGVALIAGAGLLAPVVGAGVRPTTVDLERETAVDGESDSASAQDTLEVRRFDGPVREGNSFVARLNEAGRDAGGRPYWVAYAISSRATDRQLIIDSDSWDTRDLRGRSVAEQLGVRGELGGADRTVVVVARLIPEGAATRVARLAVRDPRIAVGLSGRVYWLGRAEAEESFRWLRDIYNAVSQPRIRATAVDAIGVHDTPSAEPFLRRIIETAGDHDLREQAVESLAWHPSDEVVAVLAGLAESDPDERVAREAAETLGELDHPGAARSLRALLRGPNAGIREEALESLIEHGDTGLAELLLEIALTDSDPTMRRQAVEHMEALPPDVAVPLLRRVVFETEPGTARQAVETLGELRTRAALAVLDEVIERDAAETIASQAVESIAEFAAELAAPRLQELASGHPSANVRREAMEELLDLNAGGLDGATLLDVALHDGDPSMRREAVEHMAELRPAEAVRLLRRVAFESGDRTGERQAAESLGGIGTLEALEVLDEIIARNPGEDASLQAVESIAENFARELAEPRLQKIAREHPSSRVRREALDRLRDIDGSP